MSKEKSISLSGVGRFPSRSSYSRKAMFGAAAFALASLAMPAFAQISFTGEDTTETPAKTSTAAEGRTDTANARQRSGGDSDTQLAEAAYTYREAVGVVVASIPGQGPTPIGTAWAFDDKLFATNSHVVGAIADYAEAFPGTSFFVAINGRPDLRLKVLSYRKHPKYGSVEVDFDGRESAGGYDIAVIRTAQSAPVHFNLANDSSLKLLRSGVKVGYLGFPMERLSGGNLNVSMPIATMQTGIVTSISDYFLSDGGYDANRMIRHNLPATGGASGSPIFTPDGTVVAILFGGNVFGEVARDVNGRVVFDDNGRVVQGRRPNAAMINFAERIDSLNEVPRP